jgi:glutamate synthase (NADPH/NADH) large chain
MTGGTVVVLGATGRNFAAGMSGGIAYVYDPDGDFAKKCNMSMVALDPVLSGVEQEAKVDRALWHSTVRNGEGHTDEAVLKGLIERHFKYTGSTRARNLLDDWNNARSKFVKVFPTEYKRALGELNAAQAKEKVAA